MVHFFQSKEYQNYKKVWNRLQDPGGNTLKNINIYIDCFIKAIEACQHEYNDIGFNKNTGKYDWHKSFNISYKVGY